MKILITGASGNVGRYISNKLSSEHTIIALSQTAPSQPYAYSYIVHDLLSDTDKLEAIFADQKPDVVIHLAAMLGGTCEANPKLARSLNTDATRQLAQLSLSYDVKKFIFFSTAAVYHQEDLSPTDELSNVKPISVYGQTKLHAEEAIQNLSVQGGATKFVTFRPFQIYGDEFEKSLVYMLAHSTPHAPVHLIGYKNLYRDYIHIDAVAKAVALSITHDLHDQHTIMNLASGIARSNADLVRELEQAGISPSYTQGKNDSLDILWANISKIKKTLGFSPAIELTVPR